MAKQQAKTCEECGGTFPLADGHFKKRQDGSVDNLCLICRKRRNKHGKARAEARSLRDIEVGAVSTFMTAAQSGGENIPHSCEVLERLMEYFGGVSGFSALLVKQYFDSPAGGATRTKMLDSVLRLVVKNTDQGGAKKPLGQWSDGELEEELDKRLQTLAAQFTGMIIDGTISTQEAGPAPAAITFDQEAEPVPKRSAQRDSGRNRRSKDRGPEALPPDADAGRDARLQGE